MARFGESVFYLPFDRIVDVFNAVEHKKVNYGVVPLENSTVGGIAASLDGLQQSTVRIRSETYLSIHHCLLSSAASMEGIQRVYSHPEAMAQCHQFISRHLISRGVHTVPVDSTAMAADLASKDPASGAISSAVCANLYSGLRVLHENVEDDKRNTTRFCVLSDAWDDPTGNDKTLVYISIDHRCPGALCDALSVLKNHQINLTNMMSRPEWDSPSGSLWKYVFFLEMEGHVDEENVRAALEGMKQYCSRVRVCGSFVNERPVSDI